MRHIARLRQLFVRSPWVYWALIGGLAALAGVTTTRAMAGIDDARDAWGDTSAVLVATADVSPGTPLADVVALRTLPNALVPDSALTSIEVGATARQHVGAGEIVVDADVVADSSPRSLIPAGWLAVAVTERVPSGAHIGDDVIVVSQGVVLAGVATVVADGERLLVAVPDDEAAAVAHAAQTGDVAVLLRP